MMWGPPADPHTAWGASEAKPESLIDSLLDDLRLAICLRRARDTDAMPETLEAWRKWHRRVLDSLRRLPATRPTAAADRRVAAAIAGLD